MTGVVGIAVMPCCSMGAWHASHRWYDRRVLEAWLRDGGSGEAVFAPEPRGVGRDETCV